MAKVARALVSFLDGSFLYVELSKKVDRMDQILFCNKILGLPDGTPAEKPTIANTILRQSKAGGDEDHLIPMSRINCISILEEFLGKDVPSDMRDLWK
jgi:hypothetical protein